MDSVTHAALKAIYEGGAVDHDRELAAQRRHANIDVKMHKTPSDGAHRAHGTMVPIHELQAVRVAQGIGSPSQLAKVSFLIHYECRKSDFPKQIDQMLGTGLLSFDENSTMLGTSCLRILYNVSLLTKNSIAIHDHKGSKRAMDR